MKILVVDDEKNIRQSIVAFLKMEGYEAEEAENGLSAQRLLLDKAYAAVIADLRMPGLDGLELLRWCRSEGPDPAFVMISAHGEIEDAVRAMKEGAQDFLAKPFHPDELIFRLRSALDRHHVNKRPPLSPSRSSEAQAILSPSFRKIQAVMEKVAPTPSLILITGESGTGKEVLARKIHALSPWAEGPFLPINIGGIPETLLESELFGYEKGAFTGADKRKPGLFESAFGGTLFLDEIGELPLILQVKLLRVLQDRKIQRLGGTAPIPVEARIVAATNRQLEAEVKSGRFREDLFYRLNVIPIHLPPLRERKEDLPHLVSEILAKHNAQMGKRITGLSADAWRALNSYSFPGNIRELENLLERALIFCETDAITAEDLGIPFTETPPAQPSPGTLRDAERKAIEQALLKWEGHQTKAAEELGISRRTLFSKIKEYGLKDREGEP